MAAFTHISPDRVSRFSDGSYGIYYCARTFRTAVMETVHHQARFLAATAEPPGWIIQMRELIAKIHRSFTDLRDDPKDSRLDPTSYSAAQSSAAALRANGSNGIVYPSVRDEGGECLAAFWPDCVGLPKQSAHWHYHWDGQRIDYLKRLSTTEEERAEIYQIAP